MRKYWEIVRAQLLKLYKNGALSVIIGNFTTSFLTFFGSIVLIRFMSKADFGILSYIENFYGFLYIFMGMGLKNAVLRFVILAQTELDKYHTYKHIIKQGTIFNCLLVFIGVVIVMVYPHSEQYGDIVIPLSIYTLSVVPQFITECNITNYRAFFNNRGFAICSIVYSAGVVVSKVAGYKTDGLTGVVCLYLAFIAVMMLISSVATKKRYYANDDSGKIQKKKAKEIDRYSLQFMVTNGIWALFLLVDIKLISILIEDPTAIADYRVAHVFPGAMAILSSTIGLFVTPFFVKNEGNVAWVKSNYKRLMIATASLIGAAIGILIIIKKPLVLFIYGEQYLNTLDVMTVLFIASFFNAAIRFTTANVLAAIGLVRYNLIVSICGIVIEIVADLILIPIMGIMGVAVANLITYSIMSLLLIVYFQNKVK